MDSLRVLFFLGMVGFIFGQNRVDPSYFDWGGDLNWAMRVAQKVRDDDVANTSMGYQKVKAIEPEAFKSVIELISYHGYPAEKHTVRTKDDYLLEIHRVPYGLRNNSRVNRPAILLVHGFLSSSAAFVLSMPHQGLGFQLADAGYDVWLANFRGNMYGKRHIYMKPEEDRFWDFSVAEMSKYDLPAIMDYMFQMTGQKDIYVAAHSLGNLLTYMMSELQPKYMNRIKLMFSLAPFCTLHHTKTALRLFAPYVDTLETTTQNMGMHEITPNVLQTYLNPFLCRDNNVWLCETMLFALSGYNPKQLNGSRVPVIFHHYPAGSPMVLFLHGLQLMLARESRHYDFGEKTNMLRYKQETPPKIDVSKFTPTTVVFSGLGDLMVTEKDSEIVVSRLPNVLAHYRIPTWTHHDFLYAVNAPEAHNNRIIKILAMHEEFSKRRRTA